MTKEQYGILIAAIKMADDTVSIENGSLGCLSVVTYNNPVGLAFSIIGELNYRVVSEESLSREDFNIIVDLLVDCQMIGEPQTYQRYTLFWPMIKYRN